MNSYQQRRLLAAFRGLPLADDIRAPGAVSLASAIEVVQERHRIGQYRPEQAIMENWKQIMGPDNARRCRPVTIDRQQRLHIQVTNATLRRELAFHQRIILERVRVLKGCDQVQAIIFRAG